MEKKIETYREVRLVMSDYGDLLVMDGNDLYPVMTNSGIKISAFMGGKDELQIQHPQRY